MSDKPTFLIKTPAGKNFEINELPKSGTLGMLYSMLHIKLFQGDSEGYGDLSALDNPPINKLSISTSYLEGFTPEMEKKVRSEIIPGTNQTFEQYIKPEYLGGTNKIVMFYTVIPSTGDRGRRMMGPRQVEEENRVIRERAIAEVAEDAAAAARQTTDNVDGTARNKKRRNTKRRNKKRRNT